MTDRPSRRSGIAALGILVWLLASLVTALLAHALIGVLGETVLNSADSYDEHPHVAVGVAGATVVALLVAAALRLGMHVLARDARAADPLLQLAQRIARMRRVVSCTLVAIGGFATLVAMEFAEQLTSLGHIEGVGDALGGNPVVGLAVIAFIAIALVLVGRRFSRAIATAVSSAAVLVVTWLCALSDLVAQCLRVRSAQHRRFLERPRLASSACIAWCSGLRAPPQLLAT